MILEDFVHLFLGLKPLFSRIAHSLILILRNLHIRKLFAQAYTEQAFVYIGIVAVEKMYVVGSDNLYAAFCGEFKDSLINE